MSNMFAVNPIQVNDLEKYLRTFLSLGTTYQSHQIYFTLHIENLKCNLCKTVIECSAVKEHIDTNPHKANVLLNYELVSSQVIIYGISKDKIIKKEEMEKEEHVGKKSVATDRERSTSGTEADEKHNSCKEPGKCIKTTPETIEAGKIDLKTDVYVVQKYIKQQSQMKNVIENEHLSQPIRAGELTDRRLLINGMVKEVLPSSVQDMFLNKKCIQDLGKRLSIDATDILRNTQLNNNCCKAIENLLNRVFPGCKAYPFGSRISGLANSDSDLDIFLDVGGMYNGYKRQEVQDQALLVQKAEVVLRRNINVIQDVVSIPRARTPIVKLFHIQTQLDCDISFKHGLCVENTKFLRYCMELQPVTQPLILILKQWSHYLGLDQHINSYSLAMLVIFYMQTKNYLPSVEVMRVHNPGTLAIINGWKTINYSVPVKTVQDTLPKYKGDTADILTDFFKYYAAFDFKLQVICPLLGRTIPKKSFNQELLPKEMNPYKEKFRSSSPLCIQDPFDLSQNLTKACHNGTVTKIKNYCDLSVKLLTNNVNCK